MHLSDPPEKKYIGDSGMLKILIADDHAIVREGLKQILSEMSGKVMIEEAINGEETLEKARKNYFDLLLLDISMPDGNGLEVLLKLQQERPEMRVLVLSMYSEEDFAVQALKSGASGYLTKESTPDELIAAIQKVTQGYRYVSTSLAERLTYVLNDRTGKSLHENLSTRELQVMCMIASGKKQKKIAEELSLSVKTINTYRARILGKTGLKNNTQMIHYALRERLIV